MIADVNELQDLVSVEFQMVIPYHDIQDGGQDLWVDLLLANGQQLVKNRSESVQG